MGMGWGYRIILAKHRDECLNSELGLQSQSASALTAAPADVVHRPTLSTKTMRKSVWQRNVRITS